MPQFLKSQTISLLEGGLETYSLALCGLVLPTNAHHAQDAKYAPVMGLLGASSELLAKACLVQAQGVQAMYSNHDVSSGKYRFGTEVIEELRKLIRDDNDSVGFMWANTDRNSPEYIEQKAILIDYLNKFKLLQELRANGLHAGRGCSRDIAVSVANDVFGFIQMLEKARKLKAYLKSIPAPETTIRDREAIIEDLSRRLASTKNISDKVGYLRNLYLVLPYIPETPPDWIDAFDRIAVAPPTEADVTYLAKTLSDAHSIYLMKTRGGTGVPVRVENNNPNALPIALQNIKRTLSSTPDKFNNDILTANTRLDENRLDLPIDDFVLDLYALGLEEAGALPAGSKLTEQQAWPYVVSAYSTQGNPRPCWFIIQACDELEKLIAFLKRAKPIGNGHYKRRCDTVIEMLEAYKGNSEVSISTAKDEIFKEAADFCKNHKNYPRKVENPFTPVFLKKYTFSATVLGILQDYVSEKITASAAIIRITDADPWEDGDKKAALLLLRLCYQEMDKSALTCAIRSEKFKTYWSEIRKIMFFADVFKNGPLIK